MFAALDVDYKNNQAQAACVLFQQWTDDASAAEWTESHAPIEEYRPGLFYQRELPCLLAVLKKVPATLEGIVVDGYVWLNDETRPGLGAHLYQALDQTVPVIGVAKTHFLGSQATRPLLRGASRRPLFISAAGIDLDTACRHIASMHGPYRIPTLLKRVDQLARTGVPG